MTTVVAALIFAVLATPAASDEVDPGPTPTSTPTTTITTQESSATRAVAPFERWWYQAAPFPGPAEVEALLAQRRRDPADPRTAFWLSRYILRTAGGTITAEQRAEVERLTRQAADGGLDIAMVSVACDELENSASDVEQRKAAIQTITGALERREPQAALSVGVYYLTGKAGFRKDPAKAVRLLRIAVDLGYVRAHRELALAQEAAGQRGEALASMTRGAQAGDVPAMASLGEWLMTGRVSPADRAGAEVWLRKAAQAGHPNARRLLKELLRKPPPSPRQSEKAA
ncbi:MAG: hypothetical protein QOE14_1699 [Humisphaera sp.]|nr:hypothetical protein [Humisphaera sp.]